MTTAAPTPVAGKRLTLWGVSPWWTRLGAAQGVIVIIFGSWMGMLLGRYIGPCGLFHHLRQPALAIEVAGTWRDVLTIVGPCEAPLCAPPQADPKGDRRPREVWIEGSDVPINVCPAKIEALLQQQRWDHIFIVLYWILFMYFGVINIRFGYSRVVQIQSLTRPIGVIVGMLVLLTATVAAISDWREDDHINDALRQIDRFSTLRLGREVGQGVAQSAVIQQQEARSSQGVPNHIALTNASPPTMSNDAYLKWMTLFLALAFSTPVFFFWPGPSPRGNPDSSERKSLLSLLLAWSTGLIGLTAMSNGLVACYYRQDQRLESAVGMLFTCLPLATLTLVTAQNWYRGTMAQIDWFADLPVIRWFTNLLEPEPNPDSHEGSPLASVAKQ